MSKFEEFNPINETLEYLLFLVISGSNAWDSWMEPTYSSPREMQHLP